MAERVAVIAPDGETGTIPAERLEEFLADGYTQETPEATRARALKQTAESQPIKSLVEGGLRGATLNLFDPLGRALSDDPAEYEARKETGWGTAGEITGALGSAVLSGGTGLAGQAAARGTVAGAAAKGASALGGKVATKLGGGALAKTAGIAAEGAAFTAAEQAGKIAFDDQPITAERIAAAGLNVLTGAGIGAGFGAGSAALGKLVKSAGRGAEKLSGRLASRAETQAAGVGDDLARLDRKGLRAAEEAEIATLKQARATDKTAAVDEIKAYQDAGKDANSWIATENAEVRKVLGSTRKTIKSQIDDPIGLAKNPDAVSKSLRKEAEKLKVIVSEGEEMLAKIAKDDQALSARLGLELDTLPSSAKGMVTLEGKAARKFADWTGSKFKRGETALQASADDVGRFRTALEAGEVAGARKAALQKTQALLDSNLALQKRITGLYDDVASPRLKAIRDAMDDLSTAGGRTLLDKAKDVAAGRIGSSIGGGIGGMVGGFPGYVIGQVVGDFAGEALKKLGPTLTKNAVQVTARLNQAVDRFVDVSQKAAPSVGIAATKVLQSVSFAPPESVRAPLRQVVAGSPKIEAYRRVDNEIRSQVAVGPDGTPKMRMEARKRVAENLRGVAAVSPLLADRLETMAARKLEYLAAKLPKRPDLPQAPGPDRWQPSDFQVAEIARHIAAVEDPAGAVERMLDGSLSPEDAEAIRTVYPETFAEVQMKILEKLPTLRATLPYERRLALSIFSDVPVDPAFDPAVLAILQGQFANEPGSMGGTQAPVPKPQFGSVESKEEPTAAQSRAG